MEVSETAREYIKRVNFMVNLGSDFDYRAEYKKLSDEDKKIADQYFEENHFTVG